MTMTRASFLIPKVAVILAGMAFSAPSLGQPPKSGPSPTERAKQLYEEGRALYDQEKLKEAKEAFQKAWDLHRSSHIASNLGHLELMLGQDCEAVEHLQFAYDNFPAAGKPEQKAHLFELLKMARRQKAYLEVEVNIAGAEVRVDGKLIGRSPLARELCVEQGPRVVEATREGYDAASQKPHAINGIATVVTLDLTPRPTSFFDGNNMGFIAAGGALTVGGLVIGITGVVAANSTSSRKRELQGQLVQGQCNDAEPLCLELDRVLGSLDSSTNLSIGGFVGAGVAAVATGVYLIWPSSGPSAEAPAAALVPVVTGSSGGLVVYGHF